MKKAIAVFLLWALWFGFGVALLMYKHLGGASFVGYTTVITAAAFALFGYDRLKELGGGGFRLILAEAKEVRSDIYAKAEEVRSVMVDLADSYINSAVESPRFTVDDLSEQRDMLAKRERARRLLRSAGLAEDETEMKLWEVTREVGSDLIRAIRDRVQSEVQRAECLKEHGREPFFSHLGTDDPDLDSRLEGKQGLAVVHAVEDYIRHNGLSLDDFREQLRVLEYFIEHETLPDADKVQPQPDPAVGL